jgi:hypothetical protein
MRFVPRWLTVRSDVYERWLSIRENLFIVDSVSEEIVSALTKYAIKSFPSFKYSSPANYDPL